MRTLLIITFLISTAWSADSLATKKPGLPIGAQAPGCYAKTLDGKDFFLSRHVGPRARSGLRGPVVLSFFTSSCLPCRKEIPFLHTLKEEYPGLSIYLVNVGEEPERVRAFIKKTNFTLPVLLDRYGKISANYSAEKTPTLVVIDESGTIEFWKQGYADADTAVIAEIFRHITTD